MAEEEPPPTECHVIAFFTAALEEMVGDVRNLKHAHYCVDASESGTCAVATQGVGSATRHLFGVAIAPTKPNIFRHEKASKCTRALRQPNASKR
jgi:hypothetical protein